jgi:hypothetical protein
MSPRPPTHRRVAPIAELADVLEPDVPQQDFAFADTVIADDDLIAPPSGPIVYADGRGDAHYVTPLAFPLPAAAPDTDLATQARVLWARLRHGLRGAHEEIVELWASTEEVVSGERAASPADQLRLVGRRLRALWSCWHWSQTDVLRAAMIGIAVFLAAATFGASTFPSGDTTAEATATAIATSDDVRQPRTLEQHTDLAMPMRVKGTER